MELISYEISDLKNPVRIDMDKVREQIAAIPEKPVVEANLIMPNEYELDKPNFLKKISNIDKLSDAELSKLLQYNLESILEASNKIKEQIVNGVKFNNAPYGITPEYEAILKIFTSTRCLVYMTNSSILSRMQPVNLHYLNSIMYDYLTSKNDKNHMVEKLMYEIGDIINKQDIERLNGHGIPSTLVKLCAIAKKSSIYDEIGIKRVNKVLFNYSNPSALDLQTIVNVYQYLFGQCVRKLFENTMLDVYSEDVLNNSSAAQVEVYSTEALAAIEILNALPTKDIYSVLYSYMMDWSFMKCPPVRTKMILSGDYWRINMVIESLMSEGYRIP